MEEAIQLDEFVQLLQEPGSDGELRQLSSYTRPAAMLPKEHRE